MLQMWPLLAGLVTLFAVEIASDSVHIYYSYPELRTTSSTLQWDWQRNASLTGYAVVATHEIVPGTYTFQEIKLYLQTYTGLYGLCSPPIYIYYFLLTTAFVTPYLSIT